MDTGMENHREAWGMNQWLTIESLLICVDQSCKTSPPWQGISISVLAYGKLRKVCSQLKQKLSVKLFFAIICIIASHQLHKAHLTFSMWLDPDKRGEGCSGTAFDWRWLDVKLFWQRRKHSSKLDVHFQANIWELLQRVTGPQSSALSFSREDWHSQTSAKSRWVSF